LIFEDIIPVIDILEKVYSVEFIFEILDDSSSSIEALRSFYQSPYMQAFPILEERESLDRLESYLIEAGDVKGNRHYIALLRLDNGVIVGGTVFNYLSQLNYGLVEFIVISEQYRKRGLSSLLLGYIEKTLSAEAKGHGFTLVQGLFAEVNNPGLVSEDRDSISPKDRVRIFNSLGFKRVNFNYYQPSLHSDGDVLDCLLLLFKSTVGDIKNLRSDLLLSVLGDYFAFAFGKSRLSEIEALDKMKTQIKSQACVELISLI